MKSQNLGEAMKKNINFKLIAWFLVTTFVVSSPGSVYSMDTIKSKVQWVKTKAAKAKEKTLDRLVELYRNTQELRRKKAEGTATSTELKRLERRMRNIQRAAAAIGITLAIIAAIAGGTFGYREYRKRERRRLVTKREEDNKLFAAVRGSDQKEIRNALERGANINVHEAEHGWTPLHIAAMRGYAGVVRLLINGGANVHAQDYLGLTPFVWAFSQGRADVVRLLIGEGVDFRFDYDALHDAARKDHVGIARLLVERGADVNAKNDTGQTPLHVFVSHIGMVQLLVERGADVNARDDKGWTPLHEATSKGYALIAPFLVERGADPYRRDNHGKTPLDLTSNPFLKQSLQAKWHLRHQTIAGSLQEHLPLEVIELIEEED